MKSDLYKNDINSGIFLFKKYKTASEAIKSNEDFTLILMIRLLYLIPENNPIYNNIKNRISIYNHEVDKSQNKFDGTKYPYLQASSLGRKAE